MAKVYWETPNYKVTKTLFGVWKVLDKNRAGIAYDVPNQVAQRFSGLVTLMRRAGYNTKNDPAAIGALFSWMIAVVMAEPFDDDAAELMFATDENILKVLASIHGKLSPPREKRQRPMPKRPVKKKKMNYEDYL